MEFLGIELGSTRIKAVAIDEKGAVIASGSYAWENREIGKDVWSYDLAEAERGLAAAYAACAAAYAAKRGARPRRFDAIGISAMMHGYLVFDAAGRQLAPFRTWRSTNAGRAGDELSTLFGFHIPRRWAIAQLYQSILDGEAHVKDIAFQTTLAGYVHERLTGRKVLGVNDASGMLPVDAATKTYDARMVEAFKAKTGIDVRAIFPEVLVAGADAGALTEAGARLLDPEGTLEAGVPFCPPEGDVGTGMVATNAVRPGSGNVSAGTSVFAVVVCDHPPARARGEIDFAASPLGDAIAMVHSNNGCGELDKWVALFGGDYAALFREALERGEPDCGGVWASNWIAAEPLAGVTEPGPRLDHRPDARLTRANVMRAQLYAVFATLRKGVGFLRADGIRPTQFTGHGGLFTVPGVAQQILADALEAPVACLTTAGMGGAWGIAVLAAYRAFVCAGGTEPFADWLDHAFFAASESTVLHPNAAGVAGFRAFCA